MNMNPGFGILADRHVAPAPAAGCSAWPAACSACSSSLAATTFGAALLYAVTGFGFRRPRGTALSLVYRPCTGNSAGHHHLDGAVDRCASGAVAGYRTVAAAALGARQSRWAAARPRRLPLCRSVPSAGGRRGDDLWLRHTDGGLAPPVGSTPARASTGRRLR